MVKVNNLRDFIYICTNCNFYQQKQKLIFQQKQYRLSSIIKQIQILQKDLISMSKISPSKQGKLSIFQSNLTSSSTIYIINIMIRNRKNNLNSTLTSNKHTNSYIQQSNNYSSEVHFLQSPNNSSKKSENKKQHHFASHTELIYTPFQNKNVYVPPHLNASQIFNCMQSQCKTWKPRPSSTKKLNYDSLYKQNQKKYEFQPNTFSTTTKLKKTAKSKILRYIEQDRQRNRKPHKWYIQSESEQDDSSQYQYDQKVQKNYESEQSSQSSGQSRKHSSNNEKQCKKCSKISKKGQTQKIHIQVEV